MKGTGDDRGIALLLVLWALVLLGTLALGFSWSMRTEAMAARNGIDEARAYFQARTGVSRAVAMLASLPADNVLAGSISGADGDASYEVRVESESGKVDVNLVGEEVLLEMLKKGGLPEEAAEGLRDAILDWRDEDDVPRPRGAERAEYEGRIEPIVPRNGKIRGIGELIYVKGVTKEFHEAFLSRVFTAHGNSAQVNFLRAPGIVLRSLPGVSAEAADRIVAGRTEEPPISAADLAEMVGEGLLTAQGLALISGGASSSVYTITATGRAGGDVTRIVRCLVEVSGSGEKGVKMLGWLDKASREEGE
ncbi:MAG TPA: type II secretion system protein GspK [Thermodesulfobacteriota bacterium]|nr:type II secretion system protein GspK [Thermodesulfobacteriota bacterium]